MDPGASARVVHDIIANHSGINGRAAIMVTSKTAGKPIMVERLMLAQLDYAPDPVKLDG
jgi:hypothetical protein